MSLPAPTGVSAGGGTLQATSATHRRIYHAGRGHRYSDVAVTVGHRHNGAAPAADYRAGAVARRLGASDYLCAVVTNQSLTLRSSDGGTLTDFVSPVSIGAPVAAGALYWVRLICDGPLLRAEHWTVEPTPTGVPVVALTHTLAGATLAKYGAAEGEAGIFWTPGAGFAAAHITEFRAQPFFYRNRELPAKIPLGGRVPGDLPALCDLEVTPSGGAAPPVAGLAGWGPSGPVPAIVEGETATLTGGGTVDTDATARGGSRATLPNGGTAEWVVGPGGEVEVFARAWIPATARVVLSTVPVDGVLFGAERFSDRGPVDGVLGTGAAWRTVRLGRVTLPDDTAAKVRVKAVDDEHRIDYLVIVPAGRFISSPESVAVDASYPKFVASTAETTRVLRSDGSGDLAKPPGPPIPEHGLGDRVEFPPGDVDLLVWLSTLPAGHVGTVSTQLAHTATVHPVLLPRWHYTW